VASQTRKITFDTAALFSGKIVGLLLGMVRLNYLATFLGVANFGILNFALYFCSLFQVLFDLGMSQVLTRDLARDLSASRRLVGRVMILKTLVVGAAGALVGLIGIASHFDRVTNWAILLTTVVFAINSLAQTMLGAFQAHRKMTIVSIYNILNDLTLSVLIILLVGNYPYVALVLALTILVALANLLFLFVMYYRQVGMPEFGAVGGMWREFVGSSIPVAVSSFGISMYMYIGPTMLKYVRGNEEVGIFTAGYKLVSIIALIPTTVSQVVYPIFSDFYANAREKLGKALADSFRIIEALALPIAAGTAILAPRIFALLFPPAYQAGIPVLQLMIVGIVIGHANWILYAFLLAVDRQRFSMTLSACVAVFVAASAFLFVPAHGYMALPFIALATDAVIFVAQMVYLRRIGYGEIGLASALKPAGAAAVMAAAVWFGAALPLFVLVAAGALVYAAALLLLGGLGEQEREVIRKLLARAKARTPGGPA
jgi:O-antigen/teichoic acid export membrane protein